MGELYQARIELMRQYGLLLEKKELFGFEAGQTLAGRKSCYTDEERSLATAAALEGVRRAGKKRGNLKAVVKKVARKMNVNEHTLFTWVKAEIRRVNAAAGG